MSTLYDTDVYAWAQEQAALLRDGAWHALDLGNLIEEVESVGHSQRDALGSFLAVLVTHLLKLHLAARCFPVDLERAGPGWRTTVKTQRVHVAKVLRKNPSLRPCVPEEVGDAYVIARIEAPAAFRADENSVPATCPWTAAQVLDNDFWPEA